MSKGMIQRNEGRKLKQIHKVIERNQLEQLQNAQHDVVDVAKPGGLVLLGMMQTASPIDGNVALLVVQLDRARCDDSPLRPKSGGMAR